MDSLTLPVVVVMIAPSRMAARFSIVLEAAVPSYTMVCVPRPCLRKIQRKCLVGFEECIAFAPRRRVLWKSHILRLRRPGLTKLILMMRRCPHPRWMSIRRRSLKLPASSVNVPKSLVADTRSAISLCNWLPPPLMVSPAMK